MTDRNARELAERFFRSLYAIYGSDKMAKLYPTPKGRQDAIALWTPQIVANAHQIDSLLKAAMDNIGDYPFPDIGRVLAGHYPKANNDTLPPPGEHPSERKVLVVRNGKLLSMTERERRRTWREHSQSTHYQNIMTSELEKIGNILGMDMAEKIKRMCTHGEQEPARPADPVRSASIARAKQEAEQ